MAQVALVADGLSEINSLLPWTKAPRFFLVRVFSTPICR